MSNINDINLESENLGRTLFLDFYTLWLPRSFKFITKTEKSYTSRSDCGQHKTSKPSFLGHKPCLAPFSPDLMASNFKTWLSPLNPSSKDSHADNVHLFWRGINFSCLAISFNWKLKFDALINRIYSLSRIYICGPNLIALKGWKGCKFNIDPFNVG